MRSNAKALTFNLYVSTQLTTRCTHHFTLRLQDVVEGLRRRFPDARVVTVATEDLPYLGVVQAVSLRDGRMVAVADYRKQGGVCGL